MNIYHLDDLVNAAQSLKGNKDVEKDFDIEEILVLRNKEGYGFLEGTVRNGKANCHLLQNVENQNYLSQQASLETEEGSGKMIFNVSSYLPRHSIENREPREAIL